MFKHPHVPMALMIGKRKGRLLRVYLAAPYSHQNAAIQLSRVEQINIAAMTLVEAGFAVFSPISHSHPIASTRPSTKDDHKMWLEQDDEFMSWADALVILTLPGYEESEGVKYEKEWFALQGLPITYMSMEAVYTLERTLRNERERLDYYA